VLVTVKNMLEVSEDKQDSNWATSIEEAKKNANAAKDNSYWNMGTRWGKVYWADSERKAAKFSVIEAEEKLVWAKKETIKARGTLDAAMRSRYFGFQETQMVRFLGQQSKIGKEELDKILEAPLARPSQNRITHL